MEAVVNVAEQHISPKVSKCKSIQVKTDLLNESKIATTHIAYATKAQCSDHSCFLYKPLL